jgi:hypothetical protein
MPTQCINEEHGLLTIDLFRNSGEEILDIQDNFENLYICLT